MLRVSGLICIFRSSNVGLIVKYIRVWSKDIVCFGVVFQAGMAGAGMVMCEDQRSLLLRGQLWQKSPLFLLVSRPAFPNTRIKDLA